MSGAPEWIGTGEIATALRVSRPTVATLLRSGRIPLKYWRLPGSARSHWRVDRAEWRAWYRRFAAQQMSVEARRRRILWRRSTKSEEAA